MNTTMKNKVQLIGNLGKDPEVRELTNGGRVARMSVATSERFKGPDGEWKEDVQWHAVVAWGATAERVSQLLRKGSKVALEGRLVHRSYETKDGQKRYMTEVVVNEFQLMGAKPAVSVN